MTIFTYVGSKKTMIPAIYNVIKENISDVHNLSFADLFAGTGIVGYNAQFYFKNVISNDLEYYSFVMNNALLKCNYSNKLQNIIDECNTLQGIRGIIYKNYSQNEESDRIIFSNISACKCDAIRLHIENIYNENQINIQEYYFLLASLLVSIDMVANICGSYSNVLTKLKRKAEDQMYLSPIHTRTNIKEQTNTVYNTLTECLIENQTYDVVYLDPPYNKFHYSSNYSPLNFIAKYDESIEVKGKNGVMVDYNKSKFCYKRYCSQTLEKIVNEITCKYLLLSYVIEYIIGFEKVKSILLKKGDVILYKFTQHKFDWKGKYKRTETKYLWFCKVIEKHQGENTYREQESELPEL